LRLDFQQGQALRFLVVTWKGPPPRPGRPLTPLGGPQTILTERARPWLASVHNPAPVTSMAESSWGRPARYDKGVPQGLESGLPGRPDLSTKSAATYYREFQGAGRLHQTGRRAFSGLKHVAGGDRSIEGDGRGAVRRCCTCPDKAPAAEPAARRARRWKKNCWSGVPGAPGAPGRVQPVPGRREGE